MPRFIFKFLLILFCTGLTSASAKDYSDSIDQDLAKQCFKSLSYAALEDYGINLKDNYSYWPAKKAYEVMDIGTILTTKIRIEITTDVNEKAKLSCYFNASRQPVQFSDPWDLRSSAAYQVIKTWEDPRRW